jgi:hypothetical protein
MFPPITGIASCNVDFTQEGQSFFYVILQFDAHPTVGTQVPRDWYKFMTETMLLEDFFRPQDIVDCVE